MKNLLLLPLFFCLSLQITAQPDIEWSVSLGGSDYDFPGAIAFTGDGGYILISSTESIDGNVGNNHGKSDMWLVKFDAAGKIQWQKTLGGSQDDVGRSIKVTPDGGYIIGGSTFSNDGDVSDWQGENDYWVVKTNALGEIQWQKTFGGTSFDQLDEIQLTSDGGYFLTGYSQSINGDVTGHHGFTGYSYDVWVVKLNSTGNIQWQRSLGGYSQDTGHSGQQTSDGGYIIAGRTSGNGGDVGEGHGQIDSWVVKLSAIGETEWQHPFGGDKDDVLYNIQQTTDGGYIATGYTRSTVGDMSSEHCNASGLICSDASVIKISADGVIEWSKSYGGSEWDEGRWIRQTADGGYIFTGYSDSKNYDVPNNHGNSDIWLVKLNNTGDMEWQKSLGGTQSEQSRFVNQTPDGGYIVTGHSYSKDGDVSNNQGGTDIWVVKLGGTVGTQEPAPISLEIYPNPAHDALFFPAEYAGATALVTDALGRTCLHGAISQDKRLDIAQLPLGLYALSVRTTAGEWVSRKFCKE